MILKNTVIKRLLPIALFHLVFLNSCDSEDETPTPDQFDGILRIPVVVHVVNYSPEPFEISDEKIKSQFLVLNEDFRKKNADTLNIPEEFVHLAADLQLEFYLATIDPNGEPTTGITRNSSEVTGWQGQEALAREDAKLYSTSQGGQDAWPGDQYLNIWIADLSNRRGDLGLAGYANPPKAEPWRNGVVLDPRVFGTISPLKAPHTLGRTATHEIGHWLGLLHIFGQKNNCEIGDKVDDTPPAYSSYDGKPNHPTNSCGSNDMFMNFMDYVDDEAMHLFTKGQKERVYYVFKENLARRKLYMNLTGHSSVP